MSNPLHTAYKVEPFENLCFLIRRCSGLVSQLTDKALEPESISFTQMLILLTLDVDQPVSMVMSTSMPRSSGNLGGVKAAGQNRLLRVSPVDFIHFADVP
jgi:hypothetical protein